MGEASCDAGTAAAVVAAGIPDVVAERPAAFDKGSAVGGSAFPEDGIFVG
jgi:hypothetical protein